MLKAIVTFIYKEIDMVTNNEIGELEIINLPRLHPFVVKFENFEEANAIQVDGWHRCISLFCTNFR
jgi:hypothetical protein